MSTTFPECPVADLSQASVSAYLASRAGELAELLSSMTWTAGPVRGSIRCELYNLSIIRSFAGNLWASEQQDQVESAQLDAHNTLKEDPVRWPSFEHLLVHILRRYW